MWHMRDILVIGTYIAITCFLSDDADGAVNDTIAFLLLRWLFRGIMTFVPVLVLVLASMLCAICDAIGVMWCWYQWHHMTKKVCSISFWSSWLNKCNGVNLQCHWLHVLPTLVPKASHDQENFFAHCFNNLEHMNTMVLLTMPLTLCCWCHYQQCKISERHVSSYFEHLEPRNAMMPFIMPSVASCDANTSIT